MAFHGTNQPDLIGTQASNGCIRMPIESAHFIFDHASAGTTVQIVDTVGAGDSLAAGFLSGLLRSGVTGRNQTSKICCCRARFGSGSNSYIPFGKYSIYA